MESFSVFGEAMKYRQPYWARSGAATRFVATRLLFESRMSIFFTMPISRLGDYRQSGSLSSVFCLIFN
jgi:hypothetical protein